MNYWVPYLCWDRPYGDETIPMVVIFEYGGSGFEGYLGNVSIKSSVRKLDLSVSSLRQDLPVIEGDAVREALKECGPR